MFLLRLPHRAALVAALMAAVCMPARAQIGGAVTPLYGAAPVPLTRAVSRGDLDLVVDFGAPADVRTGQAVVTGVVGGYSLYVPGANFTAADKGKHSTWDFLGVTPTTGPITAIPMAPSGSGSGYGTTWPTVVVTSTTGSGLQAAPVMVADSNIAWVTPPSNCTQPNNGNGAFTIESGQFPTRIRSPMMNGAVAAGAPITVTFAGTWVTPPPSGIIGVYGQGCKVAGTVLVTWHVDHIREITYGDGYPINGVSVALSGGTPATAASLGTPVVTPLTPALSANITWVTDATDVILDTPIGTLPPAGSIDYKYGHDDTPAAAAAITKANALTQQGIFSCLFVPSTIWTTGPLPKFIGHGCIHGTAASLSSVWLMDNSVGGQVVEFSQATLHSVNSAAGIVAGTTFDGTTVDITHNLSGLQILDISFVGDRDVPTPQYAVTMADKNDLFYFSRDDFHDIRGSAIRIGVNDFSSSKTFTNEGQVYALRTREVGDLNSGAASVDIKGEANQWQWFSWQCFNAYFACGKFHNFGAQGPIGQFKIYGFRGEDTIGGDTFIIGDPTEAGYENGFTLVSPIFTLVPPDFAGIHLQPSTDTPSSPTNIVVISGQSIGNATSGVPVLIDAGADLSIDFSNGMEGNGAFDFVVNACAGPIKFNNDNRAQYDYAVVPACQQYERWPTETVGDVQSGPAASTTVPGAFAADTLLGDASGAMVTPTGSSTPETLAALAATGGGPGSTAGLAPLASPTFTGTPLAPTPTVSGQIANKGYVDAATAPLAPLASPTFTGTPLAPVPTASGQIATKGYVDGAVPSIVGLAPLASPVFTGTPLTPAPTASGQIANKGYVDAATAPLAPLTSPSFAGTPLAPTPTVSGQIATKGYVDAAVPSIAGLAPLASPTFTGTPLAPTPTVSGQIANKGYVDAATVPLAPLASPSFTGTPLAPAPTAAGQIANKGYVDGATAGLAPLASPSFSGTPLTPIPTVPSQVANKNYVDLVFSGVPSTAGLAPLASPSFTGTPLTTAPTVSGQIATKGYVDDVFAGVPGTTGLAPLASPSFTGTPLTPTPTTSSQIANKGYVDSVFAGVPSTAGLAPLSSPSFTGIPLTPTPTVSGQIANMGYVDSATAGLAPLASPSFTGAPLAPTPTSSGQIANKGYVDSVFAGVPSTAGLAPLASPSFTGMPLTPTPTASGQVANKGYVDAAIAGLPPAGTFGNFVETGMNVVASTSTTVDSWATSVDAAVKYVINVRQTSGGTAGATELTNLDVLCDSRGGGYTEYGGVYSAARLVTLSATCSSGTATVVAVPIAGTVSLYVKKTAVGN